MAGKRRRRSGPRATAPREVDPPDFRPPRLHLALIFGFACALYANTWGHQWTLDDSVVITKNRFTQQGWAGIPKLFRFDSFQGALEDSDNLIVGGRYRPLSNDVTTTATSAALGSRPVRDLGNSNQLPS